MLLIAVPVSAAPVTLSACHVLSDRALDPSELIANPPVRCAAGTDAVHHRFSYAYLPLAPRAAGPGDPLRFVHAYGRARHERIWLRYADGAVLVSPTSRLGARQLIGSADLVFDVPAHPAALVAILVEAEHVEAPRGPASRPWLAPESHVAEMRSWTRFFYGLFAGTVLAMFGYNLLLYRALRYPFILTYCALCAAMLAFAFTWSGGLFLLAPGLDTNVQVSLNFLTMALLIGGMPHFLLSFTEPESVPRWLARATRWLTVPPVALGLVRLAGAPLEPALLDTASYAACALVLLSVVACSVAALWRRSAAIVYYLIAWTPALVFALLRMAWGLNLLPADTMALDLSPFAMLAFQAVVSALGMSWRIRSLRTERDTARVLAETDSLTGLLNRRAFLDRARTLGGLPVRLFVIDIDGFKNINDRFGHQVGDDVIRAVAATLQQIAPADSLVGRLGGEEFALLVPQAAAAVDPVEEVAARPMAHGLWVTVSAGLAHGRIADERDWGQLYSAADAALYDAKNSGRNRLCQAPLIAVA